jgi:cytosine/adenosine deaminase-related metal-dependent hydrolase
MKTLLIKNGKIITMNPNRDVLDGNIYIEDGKIVEVPSSRQTADTVIDSEGKLVLPGFIQIHVHLNQTLFRGMADDMNVVDWLRLWIWPLEQAHTPDSVYASARLSIAEMVRNGTTTAMTMETLNHTDAAFSAAADMGFRAVIGNAMMDHWEVGTEMIGETTDISLKKSHMLLEQFHGKNNGRLHFAFCPRGTRNASDELWKELAQISQQKNIKIHTHVAENREQSDRLAMQGGRELDYLDQMGVVNSSLVLAHGVWLTDEEHDLLARRGVSVAHCPSANFKLASGIARVPEMLAKGVNVALGADGAPCNNNLNAFMEMRLAALIHKPRCGPKSMPAMQVLEMLTINGAKAAGLEDQVGSLEPGKRADVTIINREALHASPKSATNPVTQLVYEHQSSDVDTVIIDGEVLLQESQFTRWNKTEIIDNAEVELRKLISRTEGISL